MKKSVLVIDDSALVRKVLAEEISKFSDFQVVGSATDPYDAREKIFELKPDILTLDLEMPRMDGLSFLSKLMKAHPMPVVVVSSQAAEGSQAAMTALELGAVGIVPKPASRFSVPDVSRNLIHALRAAALVTVERMQPYSPAACESAPGTARLTKTACRMVAIGASTGGTQAIETVMRSMPQDSPGIVIVQHMPETFTGAFAERLNGNCAMEIREARDWDDVRQGTALVAPGDNHLVLVKKGDRLQVRLKKGPRVHFQRPSVDVLFYSVASSVGRKAVGVILTGMGSDGAKGLLAMHSEGAHTIAQDENSCAIFGMPREAIALGAVDEVLPLKQIAGSIISRVSAVRSRSSERSPSTASQDNV
jgi:two-component system, chemotaxis family, protein-glutamate methylesterase/glutaminase